MPRPFGTDRLDAAASGALVLSSSRPKGWRERSPADRTSAEHPGTAVLWEGELWEVTSAVTLPGGSVRYELRLWDERHTARHVETYDEESEERRARARLVEKKRSGGWFLALLFSPLLGHLPSARQQGIENETSFPATAMTVVSAAPLFLFGVASLISLLAGGIGGASLFPTWVAVAGVYFLVESSARLSTALAQGRPIGSLAGEALVTVYEAIRGPGGG
ncbi:MAG TPA: hypothetical protein VL084_04335 [Thermoanaerobaculia bacterium]|nr:hypothetical protein [Thermoanaerobaculia bacterium]